MHTTNYYDTFIEIADDCPVGRAEVPPIKGGKKSAANLQFELVHQNPYQFTSDDVVFEVFAQKQDLTDSEKEEGRNAFFSKGQPCFRASPLPKRYGWGIHSDAEGKIALVAVESDDYQKLAENKKLKHTKAMRSKRA
ncbi:hypothetical protein GCM10007390_22840 [Persicitalea jodogahamensis]|uniref:Uncharacterized protein n=2 Tax=Persicitalea jodogahamensis TaxID=402147 RepID=A0A8J3G8R7_9BACT|nr:DUF6157 family protein [Persicitalea jodogahamensis]GHB68807.1 hypothetical protein GCM10007390_22840 [Persicitalea jodogahamensis]